MSQKEKEKRNRGNREWLDEAEEKRIWGREYLKVHPGSLGYFVNTLVPSDTESMLKMFKVLEGDPKAVNAISDMKNAWRQEKIKGDKNNQKITVFLKPSVVQEIDQTAKKKKQSRRQVIEDLVNDVEAEKRDIRNNYYKDKKEKIESAQQIIDRVIGDLNFKVLKLEKDIEELKATIEFKELEINATGAILKKLIYILAKNQVASGVNDIRTVEPAHDKNAEVDALFDTLFDNYTKEVDASIERQKRDFGKAFRKLQTERSSKS